MNTPVHQIIFIQFYNLILFFDNLISLSVLGYGVAVLGLDVVVFGLWLS